MVEHLFAAWDPPSKWAAGRSPGAIRVVVIRWRAMARVVFGRIEASDTLVPLDIVGQLLSSMVPGTAITRYDRTWRMGQYRIEEDWLFGRIGFQGSAGTELWSEELQDFVLGDVPEGATAPFAISLPSLRIAFQIRAGVIRPTTFTGNMRALLNQASRALVWRVSHDVARVTWDTWSQQVSRVTQVRTRLLRPNPNYHGRDRVEALVEEVRARLVDIVMEADPQQLDGLRVDAELVAEALEHAEDDYGSFQAVGVVDTEHGPESSTWRLETEGAIRQVAVDEDPATKEVPGTSLRTVLEAYLLSLQEAEDEE